MKANLNDISHCNKSLDIEIPQETVDAEINKIANEFAKRARVPGFRPGRAPVHVVKTRYRDEIASEMLEHLLPHSFRDAVTERKLEVIHGPKFDLIDFGNGKPLTFRASFEVFPEFTVSNYTGIPSQPAVTAVEESEVEAQLKQLQDNHSEMISIDEERPVKEGDHVEISFQKLPDDPSVQPEAMQRAVVEVGGETTVKDFSENLTGMRVNEERTFTVSYREDYPTPDLAGKSVRYKVRAETIKQKRVPEIDDTFAQSLGEFKTADELRRRVREDMEKHKREHANDEAREKLVAWLEEHNDFEVPDSMVGHQIQTRMERLIRDLSRQGMNPQHMNVDWGKIREDQKDRAVRDVKGSLILEHVAEKENVSVSNEEVEAEIARIAEETHRPIEKVRELFGQDSGMARLKSQIRNKKTLDFLQQHARILVADANTQS